MNAATQVRSPIETGLYHGKIHVNPPVSALIFVIIHLRFPIPVYFLI